MDSISIIGLLLGLGAIIGGQILEGGHLGSLLQPTAAMIVLGGTFGAVLLQSPVSTVVRAFKMLKWVWVPPAVNHAWMINSISDWSHVSRREGLLALEGFIAQLRQRGIHISLDDFGTGFSSLAYLNRFSIDEIKIDRSFVIDLETDSRELALVQAIITLGHALGLSVVAEGVETEAQAGLLRQIGCDIFQGFLYARPMPAQDFIAFVARASGKDGEARPS